ARSPLPRLRFYRWPRFGVGGDSRQVTVSRLSRFAATVYGPLLGRLFRPRLDYLLGRPAGQFLQMVEAVREAPDTEGQRAQFDDQIVQFAARQKGPHDVPAGPILLGVVTEDLAAPARDQPLHARGKGVRHRDVDAVDRLQQHRLAFRQRLLDALPAGGLERHVGAVDRVEPAGNQIDMNIDDREAERPRFQRLLDPFLDRRDEVARDRAADDAVLEDKARTSLQRLHVDDDVGELAVPARLPLEARMRLGRALDRLLVRHRRRVADDREVVAVAQAVHCDLHMHVALAPQHHLAGVLVLLELQRRILVDELGDRARQLDVVAALFGVDREAEHRLRPLGARPLLALAGRGQHLARGDLLHAGQPDNLARLGRGDLFLRRADQPDDAGDARSV